MAKFCSIIGQIISINFKYAIKPIEFRGSDTPFALQTRTHCSLSNRKNNPKKRLYTFIADTTRLHTGKHHPT